MRSLLVCLGNPLAGDDGVGWNIYKALVRKCLPPAVRVVHLGLAGLELVDLFDAEDFCVLVDAARTGDAPGTVKIRHPPRISEATCAVSAHDIGFAEALAISQALFPAKSPLRCRLVTVEGACFDELCPTLTPIVKASIPKAVSAVLAQIRYGGLSDVAQVGPGQMS